MKAELLSVQAQRLCLPSPFPRLLHLGQVLAVVKGRRPQAEEWEFSSAAQESF